jgi:hypothetical protein
MKRFLKNLLFSNTYPNRILSGISKGMMTNYDPGNRSLHLLGLYEREIHSYLRKGINNAEVLIDIGANDGYYGLAFAKYPDKQSILCEPGQAKKELVENMKLNGFLANQHYNLIEEFVGRDSVPGFTTLNELAKPGSRILVLMDVDGGELDIVEGFVHHPDHQLEWLIETHSLELEQGVIRCLEAQGYRTRIISPAWWRIFIPENRPLEHNRWLFATRR